MQEIVRGGTSHFYLNIFSLAIVTDAPQKSIYTGDKLQTDFILTRTVWRETN